MIEFKDLEFKPKTSQGLWDSRAYTCLQAYLEFENGYGLSILKADKTGQNKYCQSDGTNYEIAIIKNGRCYYGYSDEDREGHGRDEDFLDQDNYEGVWIFQPQSKVEELLKVVQSFEKN